MCHITNVVVFYYEAKIIIEMLEKLLVSGCVCTTFKSAINRPKVTPNYFFSQSYSFQEEKKYYLFLYCARECKGKEVKIIINPRIYFTDARKQL